MKPDEDAEGSLYGGLNLDTPPTQSVHSAPTLSFSNPVYELSNPSAETNVESSLMRSGESSMISSRANSAVTATLNHESISSPTGNTSFKVEHILAPGSCRINNFRRLKEGFEERIKCARLIFPYMICITLAYTVTLSLYPGLESEIISCNLQTWMPVLLMWFFNFSDVIGKILAAVPYAWSRRQLILMSTLRAFLIPLLLLCVAPRKNPIIGGEVPAFIFTCALGVTNGLAGSLPMLLAPQKVSAPLKELSGNIMTISYMTGLLSGSLIGYVFENMLGNPIYTLSDCPSFPYRPKEADEIATTMLTTTSLIHSTSSDLLTTLLSTTTLVPSTLVISSNYSNNLTSTTSTVINFLNTTLSSISSTATTSATIR